MDNVKNSQDTLMAVISKIRSIAIMQYDNKIYDNILLIFEKLTPNEKRVLLKGLINVCFIIEDKALVDTADLIEVKKTLDITKSEIELGNVQINELNSQEMIKLRVWFIKIITIFTLIFICVITFISYKLTNTLGVTPKEGLGLLEFLTKLVLNK